MLEEKEKSGTPDTTRTCDPRLRNPRVPAGNYNAGGGLARADRSCSKGCSSPLDHKSPERRAWENMRQRCNNPKGARYERYGGRGITICERWESFKNFLDDMGPRPSPRHSLDRIDNHGDYTPENCRWATRKQQQQNRRTVRWVTARGMTLCLADWERRTGLPVRSRLNMGWDPERAVTQPLAKQSPRIRLEPDDSAEGG